MSDARAITFALGGKWHGGYGLTFCPAHDNHRTPAMSVRDGDNGRLLANCKAGCSFADIAAALRDLGLLEQQDTFEPSNAHRRAEQAAHDKKREWQAQQVARETVPISGTIAEAYLRGRGITCDLPSVLRFHPNCWHPTGKRFPALVARVEGSDRYAVHRTYLKPDGSGKALVEPTKAMLGNCAGGSVRLIDVGSTLVVAEGIETALSLASGLLDYPAAICATLSTSGMRNFCLPATPSRLAIAVDGDNPGRQAAHTLAERADGLGWTVFLLHAPDGSDWNDVLKGDRK